MAAIRQFDHVGITVADLDLVTEFFVALGLELEGRAVLEGRFVDTVIGMTDAKTEIAVLRPPGGGTGVELAQFERPEAVPGSPEAMANELGLRSICFEVAGLIRLVTLMQERGYGLVGGVGRYDDTWLMAHLRGPEGIVVSITERID